MVLDDPGAEAAVLETARGGILRQGLGYDMADVAVITNITADHLGTDGVDDLDELIDVKALVAEEIRDGGTVVLNADDLAVAALAGRPAVRRRRPAVRYFSLDPGNPVVRQHQAAGGISCVLRDGQLVETEHGSERVLAAVAELPGAFGGLAPHVVANALAAIAAWFGQVVVYEDEDKRGRRPGEMTELIVSALRRARPDIACVPADGPAQALHRAIVLAGGDAVLFLYEKLSAAKDALSAAGAQPAAAGTARSRSADGAATAGQ